jgi:hypothetical protein
VLKTLTPGELIDAWDAGEALARLDRASPLLSASTGLTTTDLDTLTLGERDRMLLQLRERLFGGRLDCVLDCPSCGQRLELSLAMSRLLEVPVGAATLDVEAEPYRVRCRLLRPKDLVDAAATGNQDAARTLLVRRCVLNAERDGRPTSVDELPDQVLSAVAAAVAEADPLADVRLPIVCAECGAGSVRRLDIVTYLWEELGARVARLLDDVHVLARAYGWAEDDILSLTPSRRRAYVDRVGHG